MSILQAVDMVRAKMEPQFSRLRGAQGMIDLLTKKAEKPAIQVAYAAAMLNIRDDRRGLTVDLAHEIVQKQIARCEEYGERAYPLSEKQIAVIAEAAAKAL